jgi:hypothetical protein
MWSHPFEPRAPRNWSARRVHPCSTLVVPRRKPACFKAVSDTRAFNR